MGGWREALVQVLLGVWFYFPLVYVTYLITVPIRRRRGWPREVTYWHKSVRFHAWWGIALSLPGVLISAVGGLGASWHWFGGCALVATLGCWVLAIAAASGLRLPAASAWMPLVVVLVCVNGFAALVTASAEADEPYAGAGYPVFAHLFNVVFLSNYGLGLAAWVAVAVNFALSVRHVQSRDQVDRLYTPDQMQRLALGDLPGNQQTASA